MEVIKFIFFILLIKTSKFSHDASANEITGCGGFIQSHADIDYSKVEVKLLTKQGSVKDTTDCSPSNGYYFLPVYDKGIFILKVSPPAGWSFEPDSVEINFDGKTDICSLGKDVNFIFKGFGITGKVGVAGQSIGASVKVELISIDGKSMGQTMSDKTGIFSFTPIIPGKYIVRASHNKWQFEKSEYAVTVETGNTVLPAQSLLVSGFDVSGKIISDGQPNIEFLLYNLKGQKPTIKCDIKPSDLVSQLENKLYESEPICSTKVKTNGEYFFTLSPGKYLITPNLQNKEINYHIEPKTIEIEVGTNSLVIPNNFEITGFSVSGKVLLTPNGRPVSNAIVKLNGNEISRTDPQGGYTLKNIKSGTYVIQVIAENLQFNDNTIKISATNPSIPNIIVSGFKVCGQVVSTTSYNILVKNLGTSHETKIQTAENSGDFCTYLSSGKYSFEVVTNNQEKESGIQFFPINQIVDVISEPISGVTFSQLRATVSGEVKCLPSKDSVCQQSSVYINALDINNNKYGQERVVELKGGKYSFTDVLPGNYEISVKETSLCWESNSQRITVKSSQEAVPAIKQTGFVVSITSSHKTAITYKIRQSAEQAVGLELTQGENVFCVGKDEVYAVSVSGCHTYDEKPKSFSVSAPLTLSAVKHRHGIRILSETSSNFTIAVERNNKEEILSIPPESTKVDGYFSYKHDFDLVPFEIVKLRPRSESMLFKPDFKKLTASDDCMDVAFNFIAVKGLVIVGKTEPLIFDAAITLSFPKDPEILPIATKTNRNGEFRFGPIDSTIEYELTAEKESYIFAEYDRINNVFKGHKLCEIIVTVKDNVGNRLSGVLLSLSGAESYRKNLVTSEDGTIKFHSLSPSQYYLKAMMKEYKFEPNSKMIDVADGATVNVELSGKRVAYSALGTITSLNGEAFNNILIEAIADDSCPTQHQEEANSEYNGQYRIRGLQPGCVYQVRVKHDANVDRSIPSDKSVTIGNSDVNNINFIAISPLGIVDVTARIMASSNEHYKTLKIALYKKDSDNPIYNQRLESPLNMKSKTNPGIMVFFPRIPYDGSTYYIEITTSLSDKVYKYNLEAIQFKANSSNKFFEINFNPEIRTADNDLNQNSLSAIILIVIVGLIFFKQDLLVEYSGVLWNQINLTIKDLMNKSKKNDSSSRYDEYDEKEIERLANSIDSIKKKKTKKI